MVKIQGIQLVEIPTVRDFRTVYAMKMASQLAQHPVQGYEHKEVIRQLAKKATEEMTLAQIQKLISNGALEAADTSDDKFAF